MAKTKFQKKLKFSFILVFSLIINNLLIFSSSSDPIEDFTLKWNCDTGLSAYIGPVSKDIDGDGIHELFIAGTIDGGSGGRVMSIDGSNGEIIWQVNVSGIQSPHCPLAIGDLDNDGTFEIVHGRTSFGSGTVARNCEDGSIFWDVNYPARYHQFAIADTDENGYPYVYITSDDISGGDTGRIRKLKGTDGSLVAEHFVWHPCFGGISVADLENDGEYEIFLTDRNYGSSDAIGLQCYNEDLDLLWFCDEIQCSSHAAVLIDVNDDGILDVIAMHQSSSNGGIYVIDGSTGSKMSGKFGKYLGLSTHCQPAVNDIDNDGNLELITSYNSNPKVWDLGSWSLDKTLSILCSEPPDFANVMGDSDLEIIACSGQGNKIYDSNYDLIYSFPNSVGSLFSVVQDIDNDGLNEVLFLVGDTLRAYDTIADAPTPNVRTDTPYYSERRTATAEYIPSIGGDGPSNSPPTFWGLTPNNGATDISIDISTLSISIADPEGETINWTIETSLDVGSSFGFEEFNGTKYCNISDLSYSTNYQWYVNATDGENWKKKIYSFTTENSLENNPPTFWSSNPGNGASDIAIEAISISIMISDPEGDPIDWTIETSPDIGSDYGNGETNGRKYCNILGLSYSSTYKWYVNATDGENWKRREYIFNTCPESPNNYPQLPPENNDGVETIPELNNPPNIPSKPTGPTSIEIGVEYEYTISAFDIDKEKIRYKFAWGDGNISNWTEYFESNISVSNSYSWRKVSNYHIRIIAQDENGLNSTWSLPLNITVAQANSNEENQMIEFKLPNDISVNRTIFFNASNIFEKDSIIISYYWDFGDGEYASGMNQSHVYRVPGRYIVTLYATDDNGYIHEKSSIVEVNSNVQELEIHKNPIVVNNQFISIIGFIIVFFGFIMIIKINRSSFLNQYRYNKIRKLELRIAEIRERVVD